MLGDDARIFDGHIPPAVIDHPGAGREMSCVKGCFLEARNRYSHVGRIEETTAAFTGV
jgi:hypothetical protein